METLPLREVIRSLRSELVEAATEGQTEAVRFELGPIELEFQVVVEREGEAGGKLGFHIFAANAEVNLGGKVSDQRTQKVKLTLTPSAWRDDDSKVPLEIARRHTQRAG
jgi:hypothetical protein